MATKWLSELQWAVSNTNVLDLITVKGVTPHPIPLPSETLSQYKRLFEKGRGGRVEKI